MKQNKWNKTNKEQMKQSKWNKTNEKENETKQVKQNK